MLKRELVLLDDINNKAFRVGDIVKIRTLDMFGNDDTIGRIIEIHDDKATLDNAYFLPIDKELKIVREGE